MAELRDLLTSLNCKPLQYHKFGKSMFAIYFSRFHLLIYGCGPILPVSFTFMCLVDPNV